MRLLLIWLGLLCCSMALAQEREAPTPPALRDWRDFVLQDARSRDCPVVLNQPASRLEARHCLWMYPFDFQLDAEGGRFDGRVQLYAEGRVPLPGSASDPPLEVRVNGRELPVMLSGTPSLLLPAGTHRIEGRFQWSRRPERLPLPAELGLLRLSIDGRPVAPLERNSQGLWLGRARLAEPVSDALRVEVYRLLQDEIPQQLTTRLVLQVAGRAREELLGPALLADMVPTELYGGLPARLESDGSLRVQVQPGRHELTLVARAEADTLRWVLGARKDPWPAQEIWSYDARPSIRITEASGDTPIDPRQAGVPAEWTGFPAFVLSEAQAVSLAVQSRGRADDANRLSLSRRWWLDFDGRSYRSMDRIQGEMQSRWRLNLAAPFELASATVAGEPVLITRDAEGEAGVELRQRSVQLSALASLPREGALPVAGWSEPLERVELSVELPPGWRLLAAPGADRAPGTWVASWSLWNVFLVALTALIAHRAAGPGVGLIVLGYLVLTHGLPEAPRWLILGASSLLLLLKSLPPGRLGRWLQVALAANLLILTLIALPFADQQIRIALHPQLEQTRIRYGAESMVDAARSYRRGMEVDYGEAMAPEPAPAPMSAEPNVQSMENQKLDVITVTGSRVKQPNEQNVALQQKYATGTVVQAGLPEPSWRWRSHSLGFDGPVPPTQQFRLVLSPPWMTRLWQLGSVLLLGLVIWRVVLQWRLTRQRAMTPDPSTTGSGSAGLAVLLAALLLGSASPSLQAQSTPDPALLDRWRKLLLEAPSCDQRCARIAEARLRVEGDQLELQLTIHAEVAAALPLPTDAAALGDPQLLGAEGELPTRRVNEQLWTTVPRGVHLLRYRGRILGEQLTLAFPEVPGRIRVEASGYEVTGIREQRLQSGTLTLTRLPGQSSAAPGAELSSGSARSQQFPPFVRVHRRIVLGLEWQIETEVERLAPSEGGFTVRVPLLAGELPSDGRVEAEQSAEGAVAVVSFAARQSHVSFQSTLERAPRLQLRAPELSRHAEVWRFEVGETWHARFDGVPQRGDSEARAMPSFDPLPGEALTVTIHRPEPLPGGSVAIDEVEQRMTVGPRSRNLALSFALRATQGGQHPVRLPEGVEVLAVSIDGANQNLRPREGVLTIPVRPGNQRIRIEWREEQAIGVAIRSQPVDLGAEASNLALAVELPASRWVLGVQGPALGPAVLYWPKLLLLLLIAVALARSGRTPLSIGAWLLLATAFSTVFWPGLVLVAGWFLAMDARQRRTTAPSPLGFNLVQLGLLALTGLVLLAFAAAVPASLIGSPDMQIAGNDSTATQLNWFADRSSGSLPLVTVWSLPVLAWRLAMLAFALWLAFRLVGWLRWAWACASNGGWWMALPKPEPALRSNAASTVDSEPPPLPEAAARPD